MGVSDIFYFFWSGEGKGESWATGRVEVGFSFFEKPRRGGGFPKKGGGRGGREGARRNFGGGGGAKYFFSGPKFPPCFATNCTIIAQCPRETSTNEF